MCQRYGEMIREDREYDISDEREWKRKREKSMRIELMGGISETKDEIKELADDEWT
jgi:hypothetical protein